MSFSGELRNSDNNFFSRYGDRCASGVATRLFSIVWTLSGLIVLVILIGSIATRLTHFGHVGPYVTLYGTQVNHTFCFCNR